MSKSCGEFADVSPFDDTLNIVISPSNQPAPS